jgi:hypothetical protein
LERIDSLRTEVETMGLMFRRRRPVARLAAGAATAGIAYHAGKRASQQDQYNEQAAAAYASTMNEPAPPPPQYVPAPAPPPVAAAAPADPIAQLGTLAELHEAGQLTDAEFAAAKSRLLGT